MKLFCRLLRRHNYKRSPGYPVWPKCRRCGNRWGDDPREQRSMKPFVIPDK